MHLEEARAIIAEITALEAHEDKYARLDELFAAAAIVAEHEENNSVAPVTHAAKDAPAIAIKEKPQAPEGKTAYACPKCGGTGIYCQGVNNGHLVSNTGFTCWTCNGVGYKFRKA